MPKTIRELADELNVSKQTIQYHYQRLPAKNQQKDSQGANMISLTAESIIRDKVAKNQQTGSKKATKTSKENNDLVATLRREVEDLKSQRDKQLATKDQQISSKDRQIDHLTKLIDQQQQLQLATVSENRQLKKNVRELRDLLEPSNSTRKQQANGKDDTFLNNINTIHVKNRNTNQAKKEVVETDNKKTIHKNRANKNWWHFW